MSHQVYQKSAKSYSCNSDKPANGNCSPPVTKVTSCKRSAFPLIITTLPDAIQWWNEPRYWQIHRASGLRVPGSFPFAEALDIQRISRHWDWRVPEGSRIPNCKNEILKVFMSVDSLEQTPVKKRPFAVQKGAFSVNDSGDE